jgi:dipeptidyl aminopeptidase/acylaminoacyl peptidase
LPGRSLAALLAAHPASGSTIFFTADDDGHHPAFRVDLATDRVTRLSAARALSDLCPTPDGDAVFALCSTIGSPPRIVRLDARMVDQVPAELANGISERGSWPRRR